MTRKENKVRKQIARRHKCSVPGNESEECSSAVGNFRTMNTDHNTKSALGKQGHGLLGNQMCKSYDLPRQGVLDSRRQD
jgi:hypothetical protein